jgi:hypothetical protein
MRELVRGYTITKGRGTSLMPPRSTERLISLLNSVKAEAVDNDAGRPGKFLAELCQEAAARLAPMRMASTDRTRRPAPPKGIASPWELPNLGTVAPVFRNNKGSLGLAYPYIFGRMTPFAEINGASGNGAFGTARPGRSSSSPASPTRSSMSAPRPTKRTNDRPRPQGAAGGRHGFPCVKETPSPLYWLAYQHGDVRCVAVMRAASLVIARMKARLMPDGIDEHFVSGHELTGDTAVLEPAIGRLLLADEVVKALRQDRARAPPLVREVNMPSEVHWIDGFNSTPSSGAWGTSVTSRRSRSAGRGPTPSSSSTPRSTRTRLACSTSATARGSFTAIRKSAADMWRFCHSLRRLWRELRR